MEEQPVKLTTENLKKFNKLENKQNEPDLEELAQLQNKLREMRIEQFNIRKNLNEKKREYEFVMQLDQDQIAEYQLKQKLHAIVKIQAIWRSYRIRKNRKQTAENEQAKKTKIREAVVKIDDSYKFQPISDNFYRPIPADRIAQLQDEIERQRKAFTLGHIKYDSETLCTKLQDEMQIYFKNSVKYETERQRVMRKMLEINNMMGFLGDKLDFEKPRIYGPSSGFDKQEILRAKIKHERRLKAMESKKGMALDDQDLELEGAEILEDIRNFRLKQFE